MKERAPLWLVKSPFREIALDVNEAAPIRWAVWLNVADVEEGIVSDPKRFVPPMAPPN